MKYVIYGNSPTYHVTTLQNYKAYVQDRRKIIDIQADNWTEAYLACLNSGYQPDDFVSCPY